MKSFLAGILLASLMATSVQAANQLRKVTASVQGTTLVTEMDFSHPISQSDVAMEYTDNSIDVVIPQATMGRAKSSHSIKSHRIESVVASRLPNNQVRVRVTLAKGQSAATFRNGTSLTNDGSKLVFKITETPVSGEKQKPGQMIDDLMKQTTTGAAAGSIDMESGVQRLQETQNSVQVQPPAQTAQLPQPKQPAVDESKQPVLQEKTSTVAKANGTERSLSSKMIMSMAILIAFIIVGSWIAKKWPSKSSKGKQHMIRVLSQIHLGPKRTLAVVRVAGETVLIGVTENNISLLKSLALLDEDIPSALPAQFDQTLKKKSQDIARDQELGNLGDKIAPADALAENVEDEFSIKGLQSIIGDRMKNMRSL